MSVPPPAVPALDVQDLHVEYRIRGTWREVLRGVTLQIADGESYGLVGESGCGKSTAAYAVVQLPAAQRADRERLRARGGQRPRRHVRGRGPAAARRAGLDGLPEPRRRR